LSSVRQTPTLVLALAPKQECSPLLKLNIFCLAGQFYYKYIYFHGLFIYKMAQASKNIYFGQFQLKLTIQKTDLSNFRIITVIKMGSMVFVEILFLQLLLLGLQNSSLSLEIS
jgi:hypothetical protein